jgi:hypothetical protein
MHCEASPAVGGEALPPFANTLLLTAAFVIVALSTFRDWRHAVLHGVMLLFPPLIIIVALRRYPHG